MQETRETQVASLARKDPLEKEMATHSTILAWRIPWTEGPGGLQTLGSQKVGHDWGTKHICEWITLLNTWNWNIVNYNNYVSFKKKKKSFLSLKQSLRTDVSELTARFKRNPWSRAQGTSGADLGEPKRDSHPAHNLNNTGHCCCRVSAAGPHQAFPVTPLHSRHSIFKRLIGLLLLKRIIPLIKNWHGTISLEMYMYLDVQMCACAQSLSRVWLLRPHRLEPARLLCPRAFSRQEHWSGLPCPPPGNLPNPGISHIPGGFFTIWATREAQEYWSG